MLKFRFSAYLLITLICQVISIAAQPQSKTAPAGTATVTGRVLVKGEPAHGVAVVLQPQQTMGPVNPATVPRARSVETGGFRITGVAAGQYSVSALAPGYVSEGEPSFGPRGKSLNIADGDQIENIVIELKRGGVITGRVLDSGGRPVVGERITLTKVDQNGKPQSGYSPGISYEMYQTDDRGVYRLYGLAEGRYIVSVGFSQREGSVMMTSNRLFYPRIFHPDVAEESQAKVIEVTEGSESENIDITVTEPKKTYDIYGRLINVDTGKSLAGVEISYGAVAKDRNYIAGWGSMGERSDANGEFRLSGVLPGRYAVFARPSAENDFYSDPTIFEISDGDIHGIEVKVHQGLSISGVVVIEGTNDPAILAKLSQIQLGSFNRNPNQNRLMVPGSNSTKVNADGSFRIKGIQPGKVQISMVPSPNLRGFLLSRVEVNGGPIRDGIEVNTGVPVTGVRVVLAYGTLSMRGEVKVVGGVLPASMRLFVSAQRVGQPPGQMMQGGEVDARGHFVIENLLPGEYDLRISPRYYSGTERPDRQFMMALASSKERVTLSSSNQQPITMTLNLNRKEEER